MAKFSKSELIKTAAQKHGVTAKAMGEIVNTVLDIIMEKTVECESVDIVDFGSFKKQKRKARTGRNPATGETINIPEKTVVVFKPRLKFATQVAVTPKGKGSKGSKVGRKK